MRNRINGERSALFGGPFASDVARPNGDLTTPAMPAAAAHAALRGISKEVARDLIFAESTVETERLYLRPIGLEDMNDYLAMLSDPDAFTYSEARPMTSDLAFTRLCRQVGHWTLLDYGLFGVFERDTGQFVGEVGFGNFERDIGSHFDGNPEACWTIRKAFQGKGYAQEAAQGALDFTRARLFAPRVVAMIHHENLASIKVARKLGFRAYDDRIYRGYRAILFANEV